MLYFYTFPEAVRVVYNLFTLLSLVVSALVLFLHQYRFRRGLDYWLGGAMSLLVLCQTLLNVMLVTCVQFNIRNGFVVPSVYIPYRYAVFAVMAAVSAFTLIRNCLRVYYKKKPPLSVITPTLLPVVATAASFLTLPIMETWTGNAFPAVFTAALLILLAGSIWQAVKIRGVLTESISGLSVKQAMDSLDTAVLFCRKNGHILMQNSKMDELMLKTAGRVFFNGNLFLDRMRNEGSGTKSVEFGAWSVELRARSEVGMRDEFIVRIPISRSETSNSTLHSPNSSESAWLFTVRETKAGLRPVIQITAADVTEQNRENLVLQETRRELEERQKQLTALVKDIEEICRARELLRVKTGIHDKQNEKLTALLQFIRSGQLPDSESFAAMKAGVLSSLRETGPADPYAMLDAIVDQYGRQGVKIGLDGNLPPEQDVASALVQILQETAANAVIHGYASGITAEISCDNDAVIMRVANNGAPPPKEIREGSGIAGMRRRAETFGGCLSICASPSFALSVTIPLRSE